MPEICISVSRLKEIAATSVALALWNHFDNPNVYKWDPRGCNSLSLLDEFEPKVIKFLEDILLPKVLVKLIEKYVIQISSKIREWSKYHREYLPLAQTRHLFHISEIIWYPNCTINYKETARNLQNSKFLNEIEKFQFLCFYCMKNEIEQKRKLFGNEFFDLMSFTNHPLLCYWDLYCRNRLQDLGATGGLPIDEFMFRYHKVDHWNSKEYFFDRMNVDEQIQNAIWIIDRCTSVEFQKLIILKLNQTQRRTLYMNRSLQILRNYSSNSKYYDDILPTWFEVADIISGEDFAILLQRLLARKINDRIIVEIWMSASDTLKIHVLNNEAVKHVEKIFDLWMQFYNKNLVNLLLDTNINIIIKIKKNPVFRKHFEDLLANNELLILEKVLNLCFKTDEELIPIKQNLAQSKSFSTLCESLIIANDFFSMKQLFRLFSDSIDLDPMQEKIVSRNFLKIRCENLTKSGKISDLYALSNLFRFSILDEFLNFIFPSVEESIKFKQDVGTIDYCLKLMIDGELRRLEAFFVWFYPCISDSIPLKRALSREKAFYVHCLRLITSDELSKFDELLKLGIPDADESVQFKQELSTEKVFIDYCLKLIIEGELQKLETLLLWIYSCNTNSITFKQRLTENDVFIAHCGKLITSGQLSSLDMLLNFIFPNVDESIPLKKHLSKKTFFNNHCLNLIIEGELHKLKLLFVCIYPRITDSIPFSRALSGEKAFGDHCRRLITSGQLSTLDELLNFIFSNVEESIQFKKHLSRKPFFIKHCLKLIIEGELQKLKLLFVCIYPRIADSIPFGRALSREKTFGDHCRRLIISDQLSTLDELLNSVFPNVEESVQFKQGLSTRKFYMDHCLKFIIDDNLAKLKILFVAIHPCTENLIQFKHSFRDSYGFKDHCRCLIIDNQLPKMDELVDLFFPSAEEVTTLKKNYVDENWFATHCKNLINSYQLTTLDELLSWFFTDNLELIRFKSDLATSNYVKEICLTFYRDENLENLNNLLHLLFRHRFEFINEYKQNLLLSENGVEVCFDLANRSSTVLDDVIVDCLPDSASMTNFKKKVIFSSAAISNLTKMIKGNLLADVKKCTDQFLVSAEDKTSFKKLLLDNPTELITLLFFKHDECACESEMKWWFSDEISVNRCKSMLSVDAIFFRGLRECIFQTFDPCVRVSRCSLKEKFDLGSLDRFLNWYFESSREIKEYKVQKIKSYEDIDTIVVLLKKGSQYSYFRELFNWFFENDAAEMTKFQRKHKGEKIASKVTI